MIGINRILIDCELFPSRTKSATGMSFSVSRVLRAGMATSAAAVVGFHLLSEDSVVGTGLQCIT